MKKLVPLGLACIATATLFGGTQGIAQTTAEVAPSAQPMSGNVTRAAVEERAASMFARLDANSDGVLTAADRQAQARKHFDAADTNSDGMLSFAEVTAAQESRREMRKDRREQRAEARPDRGMRGSLRGRMLERADADQDGTISQAKFTGHALARFDRADADSDGTISADERRHGRFEGRGTPRGEGRSGRWQRG